MVKKNMIENAMIHSVENIFENNVSAVVTLDECTQNAASRYKNRSLLYILFSLLLGMGSPKGYVIITWSQISLRYERTTNHEMIEKIKKKYIIGRSDFISIK